MQKTQHHYTAVVDESSIAILYKMHALSIMTYVRRQVVLREDAEDIVLEVFLAALEEKKLSQLEQQQQLAWLRSVANHKCIDYQRRAMRRRAVPLDEADETLFTDERHSPEQLVLRNEEDALLRKRLQQLPDHYQTVLQLRFAAGLHSAEIAQHLNKSD